MNIKTIALIGVVALMALLPMWAAVGQAPAKGLTIPPPFNVQVPATNLPARYLVNLGSSLLPELGLRTEVTIKSLNSNGTIKEVGFRIVDSRGEEVAFLDNGFDLKAQTEASITAQVFKYRYDWRMIAKTADDSELRHKNLQLANSVVMAVFNGFLPAAALDYLDAELKELTIQQFGAKLLRVLIVDPQPPSPPKKKDEI